jgi:hypothetical protein
MYAEFAIKLRLTSVALGCSSRKELCARFRAVNPATQCDLDRLHTQAWSPHYAGKIIRSALRIEPDKGRNPRASYSQNIGGPYVLVGQAVISTWTLHIQVREPMSGLPLFMTMIVPGSPASAMCGVVSGAPIHSQYPLPSASPIVAVRVPDTPKLDATNGVFNLRPHIFSDDMRDLGLGTVGEADPLIESLLESKRCQVSPDDQAKLCGILDRIHLGLERSEIN